jgi:hypothetical protein
MGRSALLLLGVAGLAACNGARAPEPSGSTVAGPVRFREAPAVVAPVQTAQGVLELDRDGCFRLNGHSVLWPQSAGLDISRPGAVRVYAQDADVRVGDAVLLQGAPAPQAANDCPGPQFAVARFTPAG